MFAKRKEHDIWFIFGNPANQGNRPEKNEVKNRNWDFLVKSESVTHLIDLRLKNTWKPLMAIDCVYRYNILIVSDYTKLAQEISNR